MSLYGKLAKWGNRKLSYVVIKCGYTGRISNDSLSDIQKEMNNSVNILFTSDNIWGDGVVPLCSKEKTAATVELLNSSGLKYDYGSVVAECKSTGDALDFANKLMELGHCAFFTEDTLYKADIIVASGKNVLVLEYDTESG